MDSADDFEKLKREIKLADRVSDKALIASVFLILLICLAVVGVLFIVTDEPQLFVMAVVMPVLIASQGLYYRWSRKKRAKIFEKYGFKCQSCKKTPYSIGLFESTSRKYCPFCQLRYFP